MATLHLLGTGAPISDAHRTTTMLAVTSSDATLLVDCGGDAVQRMFMVGIEPETLGGLVLTHEHIDHVGGFPLFMEKIWLSGRRRAVPVYGLPPALDQARRCFDTFDTAAWTGLPDIEWVPVEAGGTALSDDVWEVTSAPGIHPAPVIGLRIQCAESGGVVAYSADTSPSEAITKMAGGADILVHEATGSSPGHSSAAEAARVAARAGVGRLLLVHLPPGLGEADLEEARAVFAATEIGRELGDYRF